MILSFTQKINGKPNYFIEKIWAAIKVFKLTGIENIQYHGHKTDYKEKFGSLWDGFEKFNFEEEAKPKLHTIRLFRKTKDGNRSKKQWKAGDTIHPGINNRSPDYFQFAPAIKCKGVQHIEIKFLSLENGGEILPMVWIDSHLFYDPATGKDSGMIDLAINDGFDSVEDFFNYFNESFEGLIIHWTDKRY